MPLSRAPLANNGGFRRNHSYTTAMNSIRFTAIPLTVSALLLSTAGAQLSKGDDIPSFKIAHGWNAAPTELADLKGRLVLFEFMATW